MAAMIPIFFGNQRSNNIYDFFSFSSISSQARVDWKETSEAHVFTADLPGMKKEEVRVEVEDGRVLRISGERNVVESEDENGTTWHLVERSGGRFSRRFRLPENAKMGKIKASMENGVLTVTVPKQKSGLHCRL